MGPSTLLPLAARERLIAASQVKGAFERLKALDEAIERVKQDFPEFFKHETLNIELLKKETKK